MIRSLGKMAAMAVVALAMCFPALADNAPATAPTSKVVYHINEGLEKAADLLRNVKNHLNADPGAKIVVVGHGKGIDFMLDGAKDKNGNPFDAIIDTLEARGVEFRVCNNTLVSRKIDPKKVVPGPKIVPSGVAEIARLQAQEHYVYVKP